jgi:hypothetical protein
LKIGPSGLGVGDSLLSVIGGGGEPIRVTNESDLGAAAFMVDNSGDGAACDNLRGVRGERVDFGGSSTEAISINKSTLALFRASPKRTSQVARWISTSYLSPEVRKRNCVWVSLKPLK